MGKFDWKDLVGTVAPTLATALGGPLAGAATAAIAKAVLGKDTATEAEIGTALSSATPETLAAIRKADQEFEARMAELGIDLEKVHSGDRASARDREVKTGDKMPSYLGILVTFGFFGVLAYLLRNGVPQHGGDALLVMLGALGSAWGGIVTYYFGSSAGSRHKTELLGGK